jgi:hypothetical protein
VRDSGFEFAGREPHIATAKHSPHFRERLIVDEQLRRFRRLDGPEKIRAFAQHLCTFLQFVRREGRGNRILELGRLFGGNVDQLPRRHSLSREDTTDQ